MKLLKCVGLGLVGTKHDTRLEILIFMKCGNVFLSGAVEDRVHIYPVCKPSRALATVVSHVLSDGAANVA